MGIKGALIGGGIGLLLGGPIGAMIGAILGGSISGSAGIVNNTEKNQVAFFVCFFSCLAKLAKADGVISKEEIEYVEELMNNHFRLDPQTKDIAKKVFLEAKDNNTPASDYIRQFGQIVNYDRELCMMLVGTLIELSKKDGHYSPEEQSIIEEAKNILHLNTSGSYGYSENNSRQQYSSGTGSTSSELQEAYDLLECNSNDSDSDIKRKYRDKCAAFHPDKLQSKGLPDEFMKFATEQMTKINKAYDTIMKSRR